MLVRALSGLGSPAVVGSTLVFVQRTRAMPLRLSNVFMLVAHAQGFVAPLMRAASKHSYIAMNFGSYSGGAGGGYSQSSPGIDSDRQNRSPGIANNFFDKSTSDFKRPYGMRGTAPSATDASSSYDADYGGGGSSYGTDDGRDGYYDSYGDRGSGVGDREYYRGTGRSGRGYGSSGAGTRMGGMGYGDEYYGSYDDDMGYGGDSFDSYSPRRRGGRGQSSYMRGGSGRDSYGPYRNREYYGGTGSGMGGMGYGLTGRSGMSYGDEYYDSYDDDMGYGGDSFDSYLTRRRRARRGMRGGYGGTGGSGMGYGGTGMGGMGYGGTGVGYEGGGGLRSRGMMRGGDYDPQWPSGRPWGDLWQPPVE